MRIDGGKFIMEFWIFVLIMDLLIPCVMIGFGKYFMKKAPNEINAMFGYRTSMSMKNKETWDFAHQYCGKIWYICGLITLPITIILMFSIIGKSTDYVGTVGTIIVFVQLVPFIGCIFPTELALRKKFDKNGKRR